MGQERKRGGSMFLKNVKRRGERKSQVRKKRSEIREGFFIFCVALSLSLLLLLLRERRVVGLIEKVNRGWSKALKQQRSRLL